MSASLEQLRADIDRIDRALLELLIERTEVVREVAAVKRDRESGRAAIRPGREAQILRGLVEQAGERLPADLLVRMWRELINHLTRMQAPLTLAVYAPAGRLQTWDLARDHFGSLTMAQRMESAGQAIRAVGDGSATIAVLPLPGDDDPWWPSLISDRFDRPRVFARLPFVQRRDPEEAHAIAVGRIDPEASGEDAALIAVETGPDVSRARVRDLLARAGLEPSWLAVRRQDPNMLHLVEVPSLVLDGDERVGAALNAARGDLLRITPLGGYPRAIALVGST